MQEQPMSAAPTKKEWGTLWILAAGLGVIVLDGTIVGVALPNIIHDLHLSLTDAEWVTSLYAVIIGALLLLSGSLSDRLGRRNLFAVGLVVFSIGSIFAGFSSSAGPMLVGRSIQAIGAAAIMPSTLSTVNTLFRGKYRAAAFGVWGAVISGAAAIGPLAGGALTEWASWRWVFFVNIPIAVILLVLTFVMMPETHGEVQESFDFFGAVLSGVGIGALVFSIVEGPHVGWWKPLEDFALGKLKWPADAPLSPAPWSLALAIVCVGGFIFWEAHRIKAGHSHILNLRLFKIPTFSWGNVTATMVAIGEFALLFVLPLYMIDARGLTVMTTGLILALMAGGAFFSGAMARHIAAWIGSPGTVVLGLALEIAGIFTLAFLTDPSISPMWLMLPLGFYGFGLGLASAQLTGTVLRDVPVDQSGQGSATQSTVRQIGSALGSAISGASLAAGIGVALPGALRKLGMKAEDVQQMVTVTRQSAGSNLLGMRAKLGSAADTDPLMKALVDGFSHGVRTSFFVSSGFLLIGLIGAIVVARVAKLKPPVVE